MSEPSITALVQQRWGRGVTLTEAHVAAIAALPWTIRVFGRDAYMAREGESTSVCSVLVSGFAFRQKLVSDGARQIISIHIPGEFIDLQNCLLEVADHNVQSLGSSIVGTVPKGALLELMTTHRAINKAVWLDTLIDASVFREWVVNVGRRDARARIAHLLCELITRFRRAGGGERAVYEFPLTQEQLADATGLTPVHTNRTLQGLRRDGLITLSANKLAVLDWHRLADIGDFSERYLHHSV